MKYEKSFYVAAIVVVCVVHAAFLFLLSHTAPPQLNIGVPGMELVDVGDLDVGKRQIAAKQLQAPAEIPKPEKQKILAVKSKTPKRDLVQKENTLRPKSKPDSVTQTANKTEAKAGSTQTENSGNRTATGGVENGSGQGSSQATHIGGHLQNPKPPYPPLSLENGEEGAVGLRVTVEPDGLPSSVEVVSSSGYPRLDRSAYTTVRDRYRFIPATRLGVPVRSVYTFKIRFKIDK